MSKLVQEVRRGGVRKEEAASQCWALISPRAYARAGLSHSLIAPEILHRGANDTGTTHTEWREV
eukprot:10833612-Alexandrium_andersonii.AAC.1